MAKASLQIDPKRLATDPKYRARVEGRFAPKILNSMLESWVAHGHIDPRGKTRVQLLEEALVILGDPRTRIMLAVDHTGSLRALAASMRDAGQVHVQLLLLATWVEHAVNHLVSVGAHRKGISSADEKAMIRETSLAAKLTWLLPLLGYRQFSKSHLAKLRRLGDLRNQYVHYKWTYSESGDEEDIPAFLNECESSLRYLAGYRTRHTLRGSRAVLKKL